MESNDKKSKLVIKTIVKILKNTKKIEKAWCSLYRNSFAKLKLEHAAIIILSSHSAVINAVYNSTITVKIESTSYHIDKLRQDINTSGFFTRN